jgi:hypothetical protein
MQGAGLVAVLLLFTFMGCKEDKQDSKNGPTASTIASETMEGTLDGVTIEEIAGWAWDSKQPDSAIKVDIYDDKTKLMTVEAKEFREDLLKEKKGNGKHSFTILIPPSLKDGKEHLVRAKFAGTDTELSNSPLKFKSP